jgi:hypothetical protein
MRRTIFIAAALLFTATAASAAPILFEAYQEGTLTIPFDPPDTITVIEVSFSVDTACYMQISAGGFASKARIWFNIDGEDLPAIYRCGIVTVPQGFSLPYTYMVNSGEHKLTLKVTQWSVEEQTRCDSCYLQALIFLPDAGGAIAERPAGDADATGEMTSVISRGPFVTVTGATELVDASGRVIEHAITNDKVSISNLPQGTYFARNEERTVVKIVKVD